MTNSVAILGSGNLAFQLLTAFDKVGVPLAGLISRDLSQGADTLEKTKARCELVGGRNLTDLQADVIILAVPDDSIREVQRFYQFNPDQVLVHTSGAEPLASLKSVKAGVFYPLQTFTWGEPVDFANIPILIEATTPEIANQLTALAQTVTSDVRTMSSEDRLRMHVAAVLVSNFTNHLFHRAEKWLKENNLPFDVLRPLIEETWSKAKRMPLAKAQTGPAVRGDQRTLEHHQEIITDDALRELYRLISQDIKRLA
jgi:predicted short-subunit dehydrogenase-like oxidoreductase (DUF2520 family)